MKVKKFQSCSYHLLGVIKKGFGGGVKGVIIGFRSLTSLTEKIGSGLFKTKSSQAISPLSPFKFFNIFAC